MTSSTEPGETPSPGFHWPSLIAALILMVGGVVAPILFADAQGRADHRLAMLIFWGMSAGFVRGVGFIPRQAALRWVFSGWAMLVAIALASLHLATR